MVSYRALAVGLAVLTAVFAASTAYLVAYPPAAQTLTIVSTTTTTLTASSSSSATTSSATSTSVAPTVAGVTIINGAEIDQSSPGFTPDSVTLVIGTNNTVKWTNTDIGSQHTVTSVTVPPGARLFDSGNLNTGASFTYTFTLAGTYQYTCAYHPWMKGTIMVK